jgi:hypothetical protein
MLNLNISVKNSGDLRDNKNEQIDGRFYLRKTKRNEINKTKLAIKRDNGIDRKNKTRKKSGKKREEFSIERRGNPRGR